MLEAFIALMLLIGVLSLSGGMLGKTGTPTTEESSLAKAPAVCYEKGSVTCNDKEPHVRDLTVPYASHLTRSSTPSGDCDD